MGLKRKYKYARGVYKSGSGMTYSASYFFDTKREANSKANSLRKTNYFARVIKRGDKWVVYVSKYRRK